MSSSQHTTEKLFNVAGIVAVVTGGGTGIGLMLTRTLSMNGASRVYILGRRFHPLKAAAEACGENVIPLQADVSSLEDLQRACVRIEEEVGFINLLICNAGIPGPDLKGLAKDWSIADLQAYLLNTSMESFTRVYEVNVSATFYTMAAFLKLLDAGNQQTTKRAGSQILVTSSITGFNRQATSGFAYGSSKAAVNHLVKMMSTFLGKTGIRVNAIVPGIYPSEMTGQTFSLNNGQTANVLPKEMVPAGRMGEESDIAGVLLFLASQAGSYCNGTMMVTDGGRLGQMPSAY